MCSIYFAAAFAGFSVNSYTYSETKTKTKNCKQIIIIAKSVKYFFFVSIFFNALKDVPGYPISVQGMQEQLHSSIESPILQISRGACPRTPLGVGASGTQRSCQRRERCTSASWNTASGTSKYYRKPRSLERVFEKRRCRWPFSSDMYGR